MAQGNSGIMQSIASIFSPGQSQQAAPPPGTNNNQQPQPGNMGAPPPNNTNTAPNGTVPGSENTNNEQEASKNPLDAFKDLWETPKPVEGATQPENMFNVDPVKLREAAGKVDFSTIVTPEVRAAISKGGEEGTNAAITAMNNMVQTVYAQSALATTKIVEKAIGQAHERWNSEIPSIIKKHNVGNSLREENPALNHDAVKPLTAALEAQLTQKFPNATTAEINTMAKDYLKSTFSAIFPDMKEVKPDPKAPKAKKDENWEEFLSMGS